MYACYCMFLQIKLENILIIKPLSIENMLQFFL